MQPPRRLSPSLFAALVLAACSTEPPDPFVGNWTSRVLLVTSSGVPLADSGVTTTVTLALTVSGATISGTATGVFSGADGHLATSVMPGRLLRIGQDVTAHPLMFSRP